MTAWSIEAAASGFLLTRNGVHLLVPATEAGIKVLNTVLMRFNEDDKIGQAGFPTQHQLNEMIAKWKSEQPKAPDKNPFIKIDLTELGL